MRYLLLSDIHSNLEALEQCLALAEGKYEQALCLGDLVGYGPDPNRVIERLRPLAKIIVRGNHDKACCGLMDAGDFNFLARRATEWTCEQLSVDHFEFLRRLPKGPVAFDDFELVHGSPVDEDEYILDPHEAGAALHAASAPLVFFGHTHVQGGFHLDAEHGLRSIQAREQIGEEPVRIRLKPEDYYLINPGSVGQPRDDDWRAAFAIFDRERREVEYYRTPYDLAATQRKMRKVDLPEPLVWRLEVGR